MSKEYRIEYYGAPWCPPCERMKPLLKAYCELKRETGKKIKLTFHDIDDPDEEESVQTLDIQSIPAIFVYYEDECLLSKTSSMSAITECFDN